MAKKISTKQIKAKMAKRVDLEPPMESLPPGEIMAFTAGISPVPILTVVEAVLGLAREVLKKFPDYAQKVEREMHEIQGEYEVMRNMKRDDRRFWTEKIMKLKKRADNFAITVYQGVQSVQQKP